MRKLTHTQTHFSKSAWEAFEGAVRRGSNSAALWTGRVTASLLPTGTCLYFYCYLARGFSNSIVGRFHRILPTRALAIFATDQQEKQAWECFIFITTLCHRHKVRTCSTEHLFTTATCHENYCILRHVLKGCHGR